MQGNRNSHIGNSGSRSEAQSREFNSHSLRGDRTATFSSLRSHSYHRDDIFDDEFDKDSQDADNEFRYASNLLNRAFPAPHINVIRCVDTDLV